MAQLFWNGYQFVLDNVTQSNMQNAIPNLPQSFIVDIYTQQFLATAGYGNGQPPAYQQPQQPQYPQYPGVPSPIPQIPQIPQMPGQGGMPGGGMPQPTNQPCEVTTADGTFDVSGNCPPPQSNLQYRPAIAGRNVYCKNTMGIPASESPYAFVNCPGQ